MASGNYIRRLFLIVLLLIVFSSFALGSMLDPIVNIFEKLGIAETLQSHPVVWDTVLLTILFIMIFGRLFQEKVGYAVGAVFGVILAAAIVFYEVKNNFSIIDKIGPFAMGIVMIVMLIGLFSVLRHMLGNSAITVTWAIGYPLIIGMFPQFMRDFRKYEFFGLIEGIMFILWIISVIYMFFSLWGFMRGSATLGGRLGSDGVIERSKLKSVENDIRNEEKTELKEWKREEGNLEKHLKVLEAYLEDAINIEKKTEKEKLNKELDYLLRNFSRSCYSFVQELSRNYTKIENKEEFSKEILEKYLILIKDYIDVVERAVEKRVFPLQLGDSEGEFKVIEKDINQEAQTIIYSLKTLEKVLTELGLIDKFAQNIKNLETDIVKLYREEVAEEKVVENTAHSS